MSDQQTQTLEERIQEVWGERDEVSPYRLANLVSVLAGRYIREQMVYQYVQKGFIPSHKDGDGKKKVTKEDGMKWMVKFLSKK